MERIKHLLAADIPFARDDAHRLLPVMIACMVAFAALLLALAVSINQTLGDQSRGMIGTLQVEVPRARAEDKSAMASITDTIKQTAGVEEVAVITTSEMEALLTPWLGKDFALADLPVPVIMDVKTTVKGENTAVDVSALRRSLAKIEPGIRIEDRGPWVSHVARATAFLQALVVFIALLLLACVVGMIVLVSKMNLRLHFKTVSLLHMFGATDEYILRQFQWNSAWLAARGAGAGMLIAGSVFITAVILSIRWQSPVLPEIGVTAFHGVLFVALPLLTALIALVATRLTVQSMLQNMH